MSDTPAPDPPPSPDSTGAVATGWADLLSTPRAGGTPTGVPLAQAGEWPDVPGFTLTEEVGRGGMGVVYRARDRSMNRDVAVKLLQDQLRGNPRAVRRFLEEGQVTGRLQHPAIPAIHQIGRLADGSPFLVMKLIRGRSLAQILTDDAPDRGPLLAIFEQVCQAVGYAHSQRLLHRDLKPANVMVGAFGEVQVMDWGLAKFLDASGSVSPETNWRPDVPPDLATQAGSVMGTPAYMAPEQARGEPVDRRTDVFGLGAILCTILTGVPPFPARTADEARRQAARGDLSDAFDRLVQSGADSELVALCEGCLDPDPAARPRDGGEVALAVAAFRAAVAERAVKAELERTRAVALAAAERRRRRLQLALAASVLALVSISGAGLYLYQRQSGRQERQELARRAEAEKGAVQAMARAESLASQAGRTEAGSLAGALAAVGLWRQAATIAEQGEEMASSAAIHDLHAGMKDRADAIRAGRAKAESVLAKAQRDAALLASLEAARGITTATTGGQLDYPAARRAFAAALKAARLPDVTDPARLAEAIRAEKPNVRAALIAALDDWGTIPGEWDGQDEVRAAADAVDEDGFRREVRAAIARHDGTALARLAAQARDREVPPATAHHLALALRNGRMHDAAEQVLRRAATQHPTDFWVLETLGAVLADRAWSNPLRAMESVGCRRAALALRPDSAIAWNGLGLSLVTVGDLTGAERCIRKAGELDPKMIWAHINLGNLLRRVGDLPGAERSHRRALELDPDHPTALTNLGNVLAQRGQFREAEKLHRRSLELNPDSALPHNNLGDSLLNQGRVDAALASFRRAVELDPKGVESPSAHSNLGLALEQQGDLAGAVRLYQQAIELHPNDPHPHYLLGRLRFARDDAEAARDAYQKALEVDPGYGNAHLGLIDVLARLGRWPQARDAARTAFGLLRPGHPDRPLFGQRLKDMEAIVAVAAKVPDALAGKDPAATADERLALADACRHQRHHAAAVRLLAKAYADDPPVARRFEPACWAALAASGRAHDLPSPSAEEWGYFTDLCHRWLRATLRSVSTSVRKPGEAAVARHILSEWKKEPDLAGVRDPAWLAAMPEPDRERWEAFWTEVDSLLSGGTRKPPRDR